MDRILTYFRIRLSFVPEDPTVASHRLNHSSNLNMRLMSNRWSSGESGHIGIHVSTLTILSPSLQHSSQKMRYQLQILGTLHA